MNGGKSDADLPLQMSAGTRAGRTALDLRSYRARPMRAVWGEDGDPRPGNGVTQGDWRNTDLPSGEGTQMSFPTHLNPWYVVQKLITVDTDNAFVYWSTDGEGTMAWVGNPHQAMLFMSLSSAARVANAELAQVRVIYDKEGLRQFRPREFGDAS